MPETASLKFTRWDVPPETSLSAVLPASTARCGIYVLEFDDGERYVGKTVNLLARFATHARKQDGRIVGIRFAPLGKDRLAEAEADVVARLVSDGERLRNVDLVPLPLRSEALDIAVEAGVQAAWLEGQETQLNIGERGKAAIQRAKTADKHAELKGHPTFPLIVEQVAKYVETCLPWPHMTEQRFWTLTSLPTTGKSRRGRRLSALSVNNVEVLVFVELLNEETDTWEWCGFLNVANSETVVSRLSGDDRFRVDTVYYRPVGEVQRVDFGDFADLTALLEIPEVLAAARTLAMGLLRKGPSMFARFHDYNLADDVFRYLEGQGSSDEAAA